MTGADLYDAASVGAVCGFPAFAFVTWKLRHWLFGAGPKTPRNEGPRYCMRCGSVQFENPRCGRCRRERRRRMAAAEGR